MPKLELIKNNISTEERIQNRIDAFARDVMNGDGDMEYVLQVLAICHDYMIEYEDEDVLMSAIKIKESIFYLDNFLKY